MKVALIYSVQVFKIEADEILLHLENSTKKSVSSSFPSKSITTSHIKQSVRIKLVANYFDN